MAHTVLTFITKVKPDKVDELDKLLTEIAADLAGNPYLPFPALKLLHFASLVLHNDLKYGYGPCLVFENNFDGTLDPYLDQLYQHAAEGLHRIYGCCVDYPALSAADRGQMLSYLRAHVVWPNAYHIGNPGRTAERIRQEEALRDKLENVADTLASFTQSEASPNELQQKIQQAVRDDPGLGWVAKVQLRLTWAERWIPKLTYWTVIALGVVLLLLFWQVLIPLFLLYLGVLRWKEAHDAVWTGAGDHEYVAQLKQREDRAHIVQNHMASFAIVKPGRFRRMTLRAVLWFANLTARTQINGMLGKIPSIHFAHWSMIDDGGRLLFLSNFDGSWENYLDDFIDKASTGLTGIWSNTINFPRTWFLLFGGAKDGPRFKADARAYQVYTTVWYSAYPKLTVQSIDANSSIREDMFKSLDVAEIKTWLRRF